MGTAAAYGKGWKAKRRRVLDRDGWVCAYCGRDLRAAGARPSVDHVIPVVDLEAGGYSIHPSSVATEDLVACCGACNSRRGATHRGRRRAATKAVKESKTATITGSPWDD